VTPRAHKVFFALEKFRFFFQRGTLFRVRKVLAGIKPPLVEIEDLFGKRERRLFYLPVN
jgi:hypothetical protein